MGKNRERQKPAAKGNGMDGMVASALEIFRGQRWTAERWNSVGVIGAAKVRPRELPGAACHDGVVIERTASERARHRRRKGKYILYSAARAEMVSVRQHLDKSMRCSSSLSGFDKKGTHPQDPSRAR